MRAYLTDVAGAAPRAITPEGISGSTNTISLSHSGERVAFRSADGAIMLYSTTAQPPIIAKGFERGEIPLGWSDDDRLIFALTDDAPRRLVSIDPIAGKRTIVVTPTLPRPTLSGPTMLLQMPDHRSFVANYSERTMKLFVVDGLK